MKVVLVLLMVCLCLGLGACVTTSPETAKASTEWRLKSLEESFLNFRETQRQEKDKDLDARQEANVRIDALESRLRVLEDRQTKTEQSLAVPMDRDLPPAEQWKQGGKPQPMAESSEEKPWDKVPPQPAPATPAVKPAVKPAGKPAPAMADAGMKAATPQALYDQGMALYSADDYAAARTVFDNFIQKYPNNDLTPNAYYWKGETLYSEDEFAQSVLAFREVTSKFPKHHKAAAALLKLGMAYERLGDKENAVFYLKALTDDFPNSDPAKIARTVLNRLGS